MLINAMSTLSKLPVRKNLSLIDLYILNKSAVKLLTLSPGRDAMSYVRSLISLLLTLSPGRYAMSYNVRSLISLLLSLLLLPSALLVNQSSPTNTSATNGTSSTLLTNDTSSEGKFLEPNAPLSFSLSLRL